MKEPLSIIIFGDSSNEQLIQLKCLLMKCGICNFASKQINDCNQCDPCEEKAGLFIVSRESVTSAQMETICVKAKRLSVPILQL
ncbi:MAG: hypothetical protein AB1489_14400 [Acidobacteriota bacterium]